MRARGLGGTAGRRGGAIITAWGRCYALGIASCSFLFLSFVFDEVYFGFGRLCWCWRWNDYFWLFLWFLHKYINQCFLLVLWLEWDNWSSWGWRSWGLDEYNLVMFLRRSDVDWFSVKKTTKAIIYVLDSRVIFNL